MTYSAGVHWSHSRLPQKDTSTSYTRPLALPARCSTLGCCERERVRATALVSPSASSPASAVCSPRNSEYSDALLSSSSSLDSRSALVSAGA